jgi:hypothetical protein
MSQSSATVAFPQDANPTDTDSQLENQDNKKQPKPTKVLPTNRVAISKQWDVLRAFGAISGPDSKSTTNIEVSKVVGIHASTVGLVTPFLVDVGFLRKSDDGLTPAAEVGDFARAFEWTPEKAFHRVGPILKRTWFYTTLLPKLRFSAMTRDAALQELAIASNAAPAYRGQLDSLLEYLKQADLIAIEGDQIKLQKSTAPAEEPSGGAKSATHDHPAEKTHRKESSVNTAFAATTAGSIQFDISVRVDTAEFANWQPSRISAFFAGIAQVLAAKGAVEEKATNA